jgi:PTH2 family peptidyl-tRNA hydrolase
MTSKQVIVVRKDLNMRKGKIAAQVAHASLGAVLTCSVTDPRAGEVITIPLSDNEVLRNWFVGRFTKVCVSVDGEKELVDVYEKAKQAGLICSLITDAGLTEFNGVPTLTCCAIGPAFINDVDKITGHLKLL